MSLSKISITDNIRCAGDEYLYSSARTLLEDMARAGNPASKDHEALLLDVELEKPVIIGRDKLLRLLGLALAGKCSATYDIIHR